MKTVSVKKKHWENPEARERMSEKKKQYYKDNLEKYREKAKQYYQNNKEHNSEYCKKYREINGAKINEARRIKRQLLKQNEITISREE
jgi:hypothetical protein